MTVDELKAWIESHFKASIYPDDEIDKIVAFGMMRSGNRQDVKYAVLPWVDRCDTVDDRKANLNWLKLIKPEACIYWRVPPVISSEYDFDEGKHVSVVRLRFSVAMELQP